jgi:hypothetical protein
MTGADWLRRAQEKHSSGPIVRRKIEARIRRKVRCLADGEARRLLESFHGLNGTGSKDLQVAWLGCWSQSLDAFLRIELGKRLRRDEVTP